MQLYAQATDPDARAVMAAAADASGVLANLKGAGAFDVRAAVADAAKMAVNAARQGLKLSDVMQNADIDMNPEAFPVAAFMAENVRSPRKMAEGFRRWGKLALDQARIAEENTRQGGMFGAAPTLSRQEIFARLGDGANPTTQGIAPANSVAPVAPAVQSAIEIEAASAQPASVTGQNDTNSAQAPAERHPNWRKNAIQAGRVARGLGIDPTGKRLAQMVAEIDAHDAAIAPPAQAPALRGSPVSVIAKMKALREQRAGAQQAQAAAAQEPIATQLTPKQYHEARLKYIAETYDVPLAEAREMYGDEAGRAADNVTWTKEVIAAAANGEVLTLQTVDKLLELNPSAKLPESALPEGYRRPEARKDDKDKAQRRKDERGNTAAAQEPATLPKPPKPLSVPARRKQENQAKLAAQADYFTPGNIVKSYTGHERVVSYSPPDAEGNWSVTVQPVEQQGGKWVDAPGAKQSQHSTQPDARALKAGPVVRAQEVAIENVAASAQPARATGQNDAKSAADDSTAYSDTSSPKAVATDFDKKIMGMANEGRNARDILRTIQAQSTSKLNREVAALLLKMQAVPKVEAVGRIYNRDGGLVGGVYQGTTDTVQLSLLGEAGAERTFMHEMVHAATIQSLRRGGMAAQRMKALFARVQKNSALAGEYGVTDVYEFAAEAFSNPRFRTALDSIDDGTLWQNFVNIVRSILGLSTEQRTALSNALMAGQQVMAEDKAIRASTAQRVGGQFNAAPMADGADTEAQRQFKETERAYGGRAAYDKAKAAGTTKLTYGQWVQVRTPKFKAWFGDWQAVRAQQRLKSMSAVPVQALPAALADGPLREDAKRIYNEAAEKGPITTVDGREVQLTAVGFKKTRFHSADRRVLDLLGSIREVLGNAVPVSSLVHEQENPSDSVRAWHYYGAKVNMNGREWLAKLVVRESVNGQIYYDNDLSSVEEISGRAGDATQNKPGAAAVSADKHTLAELLAAGNPETVSKVVDLQTGEPLVVYHGTDQTGRDGDAFSAFQMAGGAEPGAFFTDDPVTASEYATRFGEFSQAPNVLPVFLSMPDAKALDAGGKSFSMANRIAFAQGNPRGIIIRNVVDGRSGATNVFVAASPAQIKSATGNNGDFDGSNPDIRRSFAGQSAATAPDSTPRTPVTAIRQSLTKAYGKLADQLEQRGLVTLTQTQEQAIDAAAQARAAKTGESVESAKRTLMASVDVKHSADGNVQGFFDPVTGQSFMVADNLTAEAAPGVLMHEVGIHMAADKTLTPLFNRAKMLLKAQRGNAFMQRVQARLDAAGETSAEEAAAYLVEAYENDRAAAPASVTKWLADLLASVKAWLHRKGVLSANSLTVADISAVARANAKSLAQGQGQGQGQGQASSEAASSGVRFSRAADAIQSSMGELTPEQARAYQRVAGTKKVPTLKERYAVLKANFGLKARQALVDQFAAIKQLDQHAYMQARMSKASDGTLEAALLYGKPFLRDGVPDVNIQDGGFAKVLASLDGEHDRFLMWVAAHRADRLKSDGRENLFTDDDISALKTLNTGKMKDSRYRALVYAKALSQLNAYNEAMLKIGMESGLIDQAAYDIMKDQPYVPFYRLMEDEDVQGPRFSSGLTNQQAFKKLKGGSQQLNADLLENMLLSWSSLLQASAKNRAALASMDAAEKMAIAYKVPATTHGKATKGAVKVMRDGVTEHWMVEDPYLLEAIGALHYIPSPLMKPLAKMKQILTMAVTVNPTFKIRNLIRDSVSAIAQSELGYNPAANVKNAWKLTASDSQMYASMLAGGGIIKFGTQENTDRLRSQVAKLGGTVLDKTGTQKLMGQINSLWEVYSEFGDRTENVNRVALYDQLIKQIEYTKTSGGNTMTTDSADIAAWWRAAGDTVVEKPRFTHAEASFMARDLMDFSMGGAMPLVRFLTQTVPFLNARLVGLDKLGRAAMADPRKFGTVAAAVSIASVALLMMYGDDEDWKAREDWDRDTYWWFKVGDQAYRIPKPFEVGAIGTMAERTAELMFSKEMTSKRFTERMAHMLSQTFAFNPVPQAIKPLLDVYSNKDSFTKRAIESQADQRLRPQDRYNERTSETAKLLGQLGLPEPSQLIKGTYVGMSPKQIDHLIRGYFSWVGVTATSAADMVVRPMLDRGERPALRLKDAFVIGSFVESLPTGSSRYVSQMYEQSRQVQQAYASYREAVKLGDMDKARSIQAEDGDKLRSRISYDRAAKQLSEINQRAKKVEADRSLSAADKRERLDALEQRRGAIAKRALERAGV